MYNAVGKIMNLLCIETHCQEVTFTGIFNLHLKGFGAKVWVLKINKALLQEI